MEHNDVWSVSDIVKNRNNWNLSADAELLKHLQRLSENIVSKSKSTLALIDSFANEVDQTYLTAANISNHFKSLSDTQFIENKVEESSEEENVESKGPEEPKKVAAENVTMKLKQALDNGLNVLNSHYDVITVSDSESENDEPQEILLKSCNPYMRRRLPYIIGSDNFTKYDHLGLIDSSSEEEEEIYSEEEEIHERISLPTKPTAPKINVALNTNTQIIRISSSDSDENEVSSRNSSRNEAAEVTKPIKIDLPKNSQPKSSTSVPFSFADHLNASLQNAGARKLEDDERLSGSFSPPPFPARDNSDYSSDEEKSDISDSIYKSDSKVPDLPNDAFSSVSVESRIDDTYATVNTKHRTDLNSKKMSNSAKVEDKFNDEKTTDQFDQHNPPTITESFHPKISNQSKQMSRALANELKTKLLVKKTSSSSSSSDESDKKESSVFNKTASKTNRIEEDSSSSKQAENPLKNVEPTTKPISRSWAIDEDEDDDDDDDADDWFNRAVSSKTSNNSHSVASAASKPVAKSKPQNMKNNNRHDPVTSSDASHSSKSTLVASSSSAKNSSFNDFDDLFADKTAPKITPRTERTGASKSTNLEKPNSCVSKSTNLEKPNSSSIALKNDAKSPAVSKIEEKHSLFDSDDDDDDDFSDLLAKRKPTVLDADKTSDFYKMLFEDSESEDPIKALVEENKLRTKPQASYASPAKLSATEKIVSEICGVDRNKKLNEKSSTSDSKTSSALTNEEKNFETPKKSDISANVRSITSESDSDDLFLFKRDASFSDRAKEKISEKKKSDSVAEKLHAEKVDAAESDSPRKNKTNVESLSDVKYNPGAYKGTESELKIKVASQLPSLAPDESLRNKMKPNPVDIVSHRLSDSNPSFAASAVEIEDVLSAKIPPRSDRVSVVSPAQSDDVDFRNNELNSSDMVSAKLSSPVSENEETTSSKQNNIVENMHSEVKFPPDSSTEWIPSSKLLPGAVHEDTSSKPIVTESSTPGNSFSATKSQPGRLAAERGLNINVNALLPGSSRPAVPRQTVESKSTAPAAEAQVSDLVPEPLPRANLLSAPKDRAKVLNKRRPPSRRARVSRAEESLLPETTNVPDSPPFSPSIPSRPSASKINSNSSERTAAPHNASENIPRVTDTPPESVDNLIFASTSTEKKSSRVRIGDVDSIFDDIFGSDDLKPKRATSALSDDVLNRNTSQDEPYDHSAQRSSSTVGQIERTKDLFTNSDGNETKASIAVSQTSSLGDQGGEELPVNAINSQKLDRVNPLNDFERTAQCQQDSLLNQGNAVKEAINDALKPSKSKNLFKKDVLFNSSDEDDPLVSTSRSSQLLKESKNTARGLQNDPPSAKISTSKKPTSMKSSTSSTKGSLFADDSGDDDQFFGSIKKPLSKNTLKKGALFDDVEDDDDLFGRKPTPRQQHESVAPKVKTPSNAGKQRAVKLRSEATVDNPLGKN